MTLFRPCKNLFNGDIEVSNIKNPLSLETLNGDIVINKCFTPYFVKSLSGDIEVIIDKNHNGKCEITSLSGDVELEIPEFYSGIIEAKAMSGDINCNIKDNITIKNDQNFIQEQITVKVNGGDEINRLSCSTLSGDIIIDSYNDKKES